MVECLLLVVGVIFRCLWFYLLFFIFGLFFFYIFFVLLVFRIFYIDIFKFIKKEVFNKICYEDRFYFVYCFFVYNIII